MNWLTTFEYVLNGTNESLWILIVTSMTCGLIGSFLVLRRMSMISDAISHSVLLGIVIGYFIVKELRSPVLIAGAAAFGLLTVWATEALDRSGLVKGDDATGLVYPFFFAVAVILITRYAGNIHLDTDMVLMGEIILAPLNTIALFGREVPLALVEMGFLFIVNVSFIILLYKELKISTFDGEFAAIAGFSSTFLFYGLMTLVSVTTVAAFDAVGAILVVSFMITPGASAYLISKDLKRMLLYTALYAIVNSLLGYVFALHWNVSMSGMTASFAGLTFLLTFLFHREGLITTIILRLKKRRTFKELVVLMHINNHSQTSAEKEELGVTTIQNHLLWERVKLEPLLKYLLDARYIYIDEGKGIYQLTEQGERYLAQVRVENGV